MLLPSSGADYTLHNFHVVAVRTYGVTPASASRNTSVRVTSGNIIHLLVGKKQSLLLFLLPVYPYQSNNIMRLTAIFCQYVALPLLWVVIQVILRRRQRRATGDILITDARAGKSAECA